MSLFEQQSLFQVDDLRLLVALAEAGSLAGAARAIRVNHASAWRRLGALEGRLGVRLFERGRDGYEPTAAGEAAIVEAERTLGGLAKLERRLAGQDIRPTGMVRLTTTDTLLDLVMPALAALQMRFPVAWEFVERAARTGEGGGLVRSWLGRTCPPAATGRMPCSRR